MFWLWGKKNLLPWWWLPKCYWFVLHWMGYNGYLCNSCINNCVEFKWLCIFYWWCVEPQDGDFTLVYTQNNVEQLYRVLDMMLSFLKILEMATDIRLAHINNTNQNFVMWCFCFFAVLMKPPYEISETGWGEFEVVIKVFFVDPTEKPVRTKWQRQLSFSLTDPDSHISTFCASLALWDYPPALSL